MSRISLLRLEGWAPELKSALGDGAAPTEIELGVLRITAHRPALSQTGARRRRVSAVRPRL